MRILDEKTNKSISNLTVLLEKTEAIQLIGYLGFIEKPFLS